MAPFAREQERCPPWGGCCRDKSVTPPSQTGTSAYRKIGIDIEPKFIVLAIALVAVCVP